MRKQKRALSLLEMMIVILLITMVTGVIGYNMKGTLDRGKVFKSKQGKTQLRELLFMVMAETGETASAIVAEGKWKEKVRKLNIARDADALFKDGWGAEWTVKVDPSDSNDFEITSTNAARYSSP